MMPYELPEDAQSPTDQCSGRELVAQNPILQAFGTQLRLLQLYGHLLVPVSCPAVALASPG